MTKPKSKKTKCLFNNHDLMEEFLRLDKLYFDGKLPMPLRIAFASIDGLGHTFRYRTPGKRRSKEDRFGIHISSKLRWSKRLYISTLLHEMVHLEERNEYSCGPRGKRFNGRMRQLSFQGAFDGIW
jgi:hypothetical protein